MHRLATCPGLDPPEDVVLVEQPGADVLFLTSAGTDISCLDASLPSNPAWNCLLYTSPSPRDKRQSRMPSSA